MTAFESFLVRRFASRKKIQEHRLFLAENALRVIGEVATECKARGQLIDPDCISDLLQIHKKYVAKVSG